MSELESKKMSLLKIIEKLSTKIGGANLLNLAQDVLQSASVENLENLEIVKKGEQFEIRPAGIEEYPQHYWHYDKEIPTIAYLSEGRHVIAWVQPDFVSPNSGSKHIWAEIYYSNGDVEIQKFRVNTTTEQELYNPTIASLSDGGFVIAWENTNNTYIYAQMYSSGGIANANVGEFQVNTSVTGTNPTIASLSDGGFVIAWDSNGDVYAQMYNSDGIANTDVGEFKVNTTTSSVAIFPTIASLSDGGFVIAWNSNSSGVLYIFAQMYNSDGTKKTDGMMVYDFGVYSNKNITPSIASLSDGGFVIAWDFDNNIYAKRYNSDGIINGEEFQVNTSAVTGALPTIASLSDGGFVIAWETIPSPANDIYAQGYNSDGTKKTVAEFKVNPEHPSTVGAEKLHFFSTIASDDVHLAIAWMTWLDDDGRDYIGYRIFAQRYELSDGTVDDSHSNASFVLELSNTTNSGTIAFQTNLGSDVTRVDFGSGTLDKLKEFFGNAEMTDEDLYINILNSTVKFTGGANDDADQTPLRYIDELGGYGATAITPPITLSPFYDMAGGDGPDNYAYSNLMFRGSFQVAGVQKAIIEPNDAQPLGYISDYLAKQNGNVEITPPSNN